jgi:hypothetical protein
MKRLMFCAALVVASIGLLASFAGAATTTGTIGFETSDGYTVGDINGQPTTTPGNTWMKTGSYDVAVEDLTSFTDHSQGLVGDRALRLSNSITSGSFGDQTFSPSVDAAGLATSLRHFASNFLIGTTQQGVQAGLSMSVSPDNGSGARMSYLRFEDQGDGVHVLFDQARGANFKETDIATLPRTTASTITFMIDFNAASSKAVTIKINNVVKATGSTWESYYQTQEHNPTPTVSKMLFRLGGTAVPANAGKGFLVDSLTLTSS